MNDKIDIAYRDLIAAVIIQAIEDYEKAMISLKRSEKTIREIESFFNKSDLIGLLSTEDDDFEGKEMLKIIKARYA